MDSVHPSPLEPNSIELTPIPRKAPEKETLSAPPEEPRPSWFKRTIATCILPALTIKESTESAKVTHATPLETPFSKFGPHKEGSIFFQNNTIPCHQFQFNENPSNYQLICLSANQLDQEKYLAMIEECQRTQTNVVIAVINKKIDTKKN